MAMTMSDDVFHYCPANDMRYVPHPDCVYHMECNDPIYRLFDLAKVASEGSKRLPEYRSEFMEIAQHCRKLSANIMDYCENSEEVNTVLQEKAGAMKYFGHHVGYMSYPRVRLAIEHSHKEFVGQMYCQQYLRNEWHGHTPWLGKLFTFKLVYSLIQILLSPIYVIHALFVFSGRDLKYMNDNELPEVSSARTPFQRTLFRFMHYCENTTLNLDAPLNRFLTMIGYYMVFLFLLSIAAVRPASVTFSGGVDDRVDFEWFHWCIMIYSLNVLYKHLLTYFQLQTVSHFFNIWRFASLFTHSFLFTSLLLRLILYIDDPCQHVTANIYSCPEEDLHRRQLWSNVSLCLFGVATVGAIMKLTYYMQMHEKIGPVVISYSRITLDFVSMVVLYALLILAFSLGFAYMFTGDVFLTETDRPLNVSMNGSLLDEYSDFYDSIYSAGFVELMNNLFWAILNPGPSDFFDIDSGVFTFIQLNYALYQVMAVVVFLNLLIATMNSTVQRIDNERELFWKFTRTSIWIEFYDVTSALPPPFTMTNIVWIIFYVTVMATKKSRKRMAARLGRVLDDDNSFSFSECKNDRSAFKKRQKHARIMVGIIDKMMRDKRFLKLYDK